MATLDTATRTGSGVVPAILAGGFAAAILDIIFACTYAYIRSGVAPGAVLKYIAGGWVGLAAARDGGMEMMLLGAASHAFIALCAAAAYVLVSKPLPVLRRQWIVLGLLYGSFLHFFMNFVVVPLSAIHRAYPDILTADFGINLVAQALLFGLPIAFYAQRYLGRD